MLENQFFCTNNQTGSFYNTNNYLYKYREQSWLIKYSTVQYSTAQIQRECNTLKKYLIEAGVRIFSFFLVFFFFFTQAIFTNFLIKEMFKTISHGVDV